MRVRVVVAAVAFAAMPCIAMAQDCEGDRTAASGVLAVEVSGVQPAKGQVAVTVYPNDRKRFLAPKGKLLRQRVEVTAPVTRACFNLPAGTYAVVVYHDANSNGAFDRTLAGLPAEGFGFSNDAPSRIGLPPLDAVRFRFTPDDPPTRIAMRYLKR